MELMGVIFVIILVSAATVGTLQNVSKAGITTSASQVAVAIRYLYDLSVLNNRSYRLVIDMENNAYWGEEIDTTGSACGAGLLPSDEERRFGASTKTKTRKNLTVAPMSDEDDEAKKTTASGTALKDNLLKRRDLPKGTSFSGVMSSHQDDLVESGRGEVYFFPGGYVEKAYIYLKRNDDEYTVETQPLRGMGIVHHEGLDPRDLMDRT